MAAGTEWTLHYRSKATMPKHAEDLDIGGAVRAIIVDDEKLGRQLVRNLSEGTPVLDIVGEYANGADAIAAIRSLQPEVVFLDIKMPGISGLSVAREILNENCLVIFVTAFEMYALEAFEVQAFDYLLKPIDYQRFDTVAERIVRTVRRVRLERVLEANPGKMLHLAGTVDKPALESSARIKIRDANTIRFIDPGKVIWFEAANQYVEIHALSGNYLISTESLNSLQEKVDPSVFVRVHRSAIVNINYAHCIRVDSDGVYFVEMSNGDRVRISRSKRSVVENLDL